MKVYNSFYGIYSNVTEVFPLYLLLLDIRQQVDELREELKELLLSHELQTIAVVIFARNLTRPEARGDFLELVKLVRLSAANQVGDGLD